MLALLPTDHDWPLHDAAASRQAEALALARHPPHTLIERAGLAVARLALSLVPHGRRVIVLAGPGNNGGDGLIAARWLAARGWQVTIHLIGHGASRPGSDAAHALGSVAACSPQSGLPEALGDADLLIDALLGLGATRAPEGALAEAIRAINAHPAPVLAIDLPSGLSADTGQPLGDVAVRADHTLSLLTLKPGLLTGEGRALAGRLWFDDLGEPLDAVAPSARLAGRERFERWQTSFTRSATSHKGRHGDVVVVGGGPSMRGAAWLAAMAALTAGAGRVYAALPDDDGQPWPARPELMHWDTQKWRAPSASWRDVLAVCGCGGGTAIAPLLPPLLQSTLRLVLDADALNLIAADPALQDAVRRRGDHGLSTILTPHPLEAARLLGLKGAADIQRDRLHAARSLADRLHCTVVLKGSGSVIAAPGQTPVINSTGSAALATAGTGDVLAGWMGGMWAQSPALEAQALACAAAAWHGAAAEGHAGPLLAADLVQAMAKAHSALA